MPETTLIKIDELSRLLSIPKGTLYNRVYQRRIPFIKVGRSLRFSAEEVIRSLQHFSIPDAADRNGKGR